MEQHGLWGSFQRDESQVSRGSEACGLGSTQELMWFLFEYTLFSARGFLPCLPKRSWIRTPAKGLGCFKLTDGGPLLVRRLRANVQWP